MKAEDVIKAEELINRIMVIRSFLTKKEIKHVTSTYRLHDFRKTEKIKSLEGIINDVTQKSGCVWIDNPSGTNFILSIKDLKKILENYNFVFRKGLSVN